MTPKRILFIIRSYRPDKVGGGAKSVQNLAEGLIARGHDVHILRLAPSGEQNAYLQAAEEAGVVGEGKPRMHVLPIRNIYWPYAKKRHSQFAKAIWHLLDIYNPLAARSIRPFLKELRPDIVNTSIIDGFSTSIFREAKRSGAKLIHTMRDYYLVCLRSGMYKSNKNCTSLCSECKIVRSINKIQAKYVDLFLSNSDFVAKTHRKYGVFSDSKTCAVQWNVNERPLVPNPKSITDEQTITFGYIGRLAPTKGVEKLIEAAQLLPETGKLWSLVIAGDGASDYVDNLKTLAKNNPRVKFLGWQASEDFYSSVDVVICPSVYNEPLPRVIYEAYGFALPVIASNVGGNPEVLTSGNSGELYDGDNPAELAEKLQIFREMHVERYAEYSAAALKMGAIFTSNSVIDRYEEHLNNLYHNS